MRSRIIETLDLGALSFLIPDFTFMLTLPLVLGALITLRQRRRQGLSEAHSYQSVFYAVLFVIPGARLVYFFTIPTPFFGTRASRKRAIDPAAGILESVRLDPPRENRGDLGLSTLGEIR